MALHKADGGGARQARKRADAGRAHPGGPVSGELPRLRRLRAGGAQPAGAALRRRLLRRAVADQRGRRRALLLCVADVSGKGLPAALVMSNMQATLRALLGRLRSLPALAAHASDLLYRLDVAGKIRDRGARGARSGNRRGAFVGAGHLDNVIVRSTERSSALSSTGAPLGLLPAGLPYERDRRRARTRRRARALLGRRHRRAGRDRTRSSARRGCSDVLASAAGQTPDVVIDRIFDAIDAFAGDAPQFDDMTMLVVRRL